MARQGVKVVTQARRKKLSERLAEEQEQEPDEEQPEDEEEPEDEDDFTDEDDEDEEPVEEEEPEAEEAEEDDKLPTSLSFSISEDSIEVSVPRDGNEANTLRSLAKIVDKMT